VAFIARGATLDALRKDGLRVESPLGEIVLPEVEATDDPSNVGEVDVVILGVKAWQVPEVAEEIRPMIGQETAVLPCVDPPPEFRAVRGLC
jgi:2-dehydropantoate 2-reductase